MNIKIAEVGRYMMEAFEYLLTIEQLLGECVRLADDNGDSMIAAYLCQALDLVQHQTLARVGATLPTGPTLVQ